ncbi:hypothetical protein CEXT_131301 [Caerostris extrusa]|uniref:Uncharacterized protein n=1 Tax=Caerostris extrusa TaxID=172846 RepID=A0AAV4Y7G9_CAEEX|nr:hypothetical protein CEXT_131301 [Caerostris extrusa]
MGSGRGSFTAFRLSRRGGRWRKKSKKSSGEGDLTRSFRIDVISLPPPLLLQDGGTINRLEMTISKSNRLFPLSFSKGEGEMFSLVGEKLDELWFSDGGPRVRSNSNCFVVSLRRRVLVKLMWCFVGQLN